MDFLRSDAFAAGEVLHKLNRGARLLITVLFKQP